MHPNLARAVLTRALLACVAVAVAACGGGGGGSENAPATAATSATSGLSTAQAAVATPSAAGQTWYVDSGAGNDTNPGTAAAPWKTLARAQSQRLAAGDALLLKCGGLWRESLNIDTQNAPAGGVTVGTWGSCSSTSQAVISGADAVTGVSWQRATGFGSNPVYVTSWSAPVSQLFWNGKPLIRARSPNYGGIGREFSRVASSSGSVVKLAAADATALAGLDLTGTRLLARTAPWFAQWLDVTAGTAATGLTLAVDPGAAPRAGQGYVIEGALSLLDSAGEWFQDRATGRLYVWTSSGADPGTGLLESVARDIGVAIVGVPDVQVQQIALERQAMVAVWVHGAARTTVRTVSSLYAGGVAVLVEPDEAGVASDGSTVTGCTIGHSSTMGISAAGANLTITANQLDAIGVEPNSGDVSAGIYVDAMGANVSDNRINQTAFAGLIFGQPTGLTVSGNVLTAACARFTDCGAVYVGGGSRNASRSVITSNAVSSMKPNMDGNLPDDSDLVSGIYLDEDSASMDVAGNFIVRVGVGINLHNASNNLVQGNTVWLSDRASLRVQSSAATDNVRGNTVQDNLLFGASHLGAAADATSAPQQLEVFPQEWQHLTDTALMFSGSSPNVVRRNTNISLSPGSALRWSMLDGWTHNRLTFAEWGQRASAETVQASYVARPFIVTAGSSNLISNPALTAPGTGWTFWSPVPAAGATLTYGSCGASGCADLRAATDSDFLLSNSFRLNSAAGSSLYAARAQVQGLTGGGGALSVAINRAGGDFAELGFVSMDNPIAAGTGLWIDGLFNATATDTASLNLVAANRSALRLVSASVVQVSSYQLFDPAQESTLLVNEGTTPRSIACPATLRTCTVTDLQGLPISWPVTLPARSAKAVVSSDGKWRATF